MKRTKLGVAAALLTTVSMLAACGSTQETGNAGSVNSSAENAATESASASTQETEEKEPVTLQYFTWTSGSMSAIEPMVEKFNETNEDNITVEIVLKTGEWQTALKTAILSDQAPDILHGVNDVTEALSNGWIEPWDNYLSDEFKEKIDPYTYKVEVDGQVNTYAFVWGAKTYKMAYNKELFAAAGITELPTTWEQVYDCAKKITETGNGDYYGFGLAGAPSGGAVAFIMEPIGAREGYYKMGYDFANNAYDFSYAKPYIELFRQMNAEGLTFPGAETLDNDSLRAQFAAGKIGIIPSVSWDCAAINDQFEASCDWGVIEWPAAMGGENKGALCLRDSANYMLSASSKNKEAAATFVEFMLGEDFQSELLSQATDMSVLPWALEAAKAKPASTHPQWVEYSATEDMVPVSNVSLGVQITGDNEATTMATLIGSPDMDIDSTLVDLSTRYNTGLYEQAKVDEVKAMTAGKEIGFLGKIMSIENFDPIQPIQPENIKYLSAEEWKALQPQ